MQFQIFYKDVHLTTSLSPSLSLVSDKHVIKVVVIIQWMVIKAIRLVVVGKITLVNREMASNRKNFRYLIVKMSVLNEMPISPTILWCLSDLMTGNARARISAGLKQSRIKTIV
jgi:hypothetical protein